MSDVCVEGHFDAHKRANGSPVDFSGAEACTQECRASGFLHWRRQEGGIDAHLLHYAGLIDEQRQCGSQMDFIVDFGRERNLDR